MRKIIKIIVGQNLLEFYLIVYFLNNTYYTKYQNTKTHMKNET